MAKKQNRWLVNSVLILALLAFVGLSALPLISGMANRGADSEAANTANAEAQSERERLEAEARGYELVVQREPDNVTALKGLIEARLQLRDIEGTIEPLQKLADLEPDEPVYGILLAQAQQQVGDLEGAARTYRTMLDRRPNDPNALQGLATLLVEQDRPQAAVGLLQDALDSAIAAREEDPDSVDVTSIRMLLGQVYAELERYDDAITAYDLAIDEDPENFRPLLAKAIVLRSKGQEQDAQSLFATATSLAPDRYKDSIRQLATESSPEASEDAGEALLDGEVAPAPSDAPSE